MGTRINSIEGCFEGGIASTGSAYGSRNIHTIYIFKCPHGENGAGEEAVVIGGDTRSGIGRVQRGNCRSVIGGGCTAGIRKSGI